MPSKRVSLKGKGADLFFGSESSPPPQIADATANQETDAALQEQAETPVVPDSPELRPRRANKARGSNGNQRDMSDDHSAAGESRTASYRASKLASTSDDGDRATIDGIRTVVKEAGREVSFVRLSPTEKRRLADIVYTYKRQGVKTSENEINRIAINLLLSDYETNGEQSVLAKVLTSLQA